MPNIQSDDLIGFTTQVKEFLTKYKPKLVASNYDPTNDMAGLGGDCQTFATESQEQESLKTTLKIKTGEVTALASDLYDTTSTILDAAIGKLGKKSAEGREGAKIRSTLRGRKPKPAPAPTP